MAVSKTFFEGEVLTAADLNGALEGLDSDRAALADVVTAQTVKAARGTGAALNGTPPTNGLGARIVGGTTVVTTNAAGDAIIKHGGAFNTAVLAVVCWSGDYANGAFIARNTGLGEDKKNDVAIRVFNANGTVRASSPVRVDYLAVGW